jgi:hypothetical protein
VTLHNRSFRPIFGEHLNFNLFGYPNLSDIQKGFLIRSIAGLIGVMVVMIVVGWASFGSRTL